MIWLSRSSGCSEMVTFFPVGRCAENSASMEQSNPSPVSHRLEQRGPCPLCVERRRCGHVQPLPCADAGCVVDEHDRCVPIPRPLGLGTRRFVLAEHRSRPLVPGGWIGRSTCLRLGSVIGKPRPNSNLTLKGLARPTDFWHKPWILCEERDPARPSSAVSPPLLGSSAHKRGTSSRASTPIALV